MWRGGYTFRSFGPPPRRTSASFHVDCSLIAAVALLSNYVGQTFAPDSTRGLQPYDVATDDRVGGCGKTARVPSLTPADLPVLLSEWRARKPKTRARLCRLCVVPGQFRGYRKKKGVAADSTMDMFAALRLEVDSWRWKA